jgi:penicillin-binding protein 1A
MREAIQDSLNIYAVKTITEITPELGIKYAEKLGINTLIDNEEINGEVFSDANQTLALGGITYGVRNIELNAAFATIANGGKYIVPRLYTKVVDQQGRVVLDNTDPEKERVLKKTTCYLLTDAMKDVLTKGTGTAANFTTTAVAGKTGTTEESNDVWFSGYTPNYTATVWAGYDNNTKLQKNEESLAMIIWRQVMSNIEANKHSSDFHKPDGLTTAVVCKDTGQLAVPDYCDHAYTEYFVKGTEPTSYCSVGQKKKQKAAEKKKKEEEEKKKKEQEEAQKKKAAETPRSIYGADDD